MTQLHTELWVVMPVYNEQDSLRSVVAEWLSCLRGLELNFVLCLINDGSRDRSLKVIREFEKNNAEILTVDQPNMGHGQTCIIGYRKAIAHKAQYVFQVDSDGQCDPAHFPAFWQMRDQCAAVFGRRKHRQDGFVRALGSQVLRGLVRLCSGVSVLDPNVPYRLMQTSVLPDKLGVIPADVDLANVLLAVALERQGHICWVEIGFRCRNAGISATGLAVLIKKCWQLAPQLVRFRLQLERFSANN